MKQRNAVEYKEILLAGRWFAGLDDALRNALLKMATVRRLQTHEALFQRGSAPDGLYATVEGALRITGFGSGGEEAMLALAEPPTWFGEISVFDRQPRTHDAVATMPSAVVHVPEAPLYALLDATPKYWRDLGRLVATKLRLAFEMIEDMALLPLSARLSRRLLLMAQRHGDWHDRSSRTIELSQEQLALMLATSRQTMNQLLKELEGKGAIRVAYGTIEIVDLVVLKASAKVNA